MADRPDPGERRRPVTRRDGRRRRDTDYLRLDDLRDPATRLYLEAILHPADSEDRDMLEAGIAEILRRRREVADLMAKVTRLRRATADQQQQIQQLVKKVRKLNRERDEFRTGDFTAAVNDAKVAAVKAVERHTGPGMAREVADDLHIEWEA